MHAFPAARDAPTGTNHTQTALPRALTVTPSALVVTGDAFRALSSALVARVRAEGDPMPMADSTRDAEDLPSTAWIETRKAFRAPPTADVILVNAYGATLDANDASAFSLGAAVRSDAVTIHSDDVTKDVDDETVEVHDKTMSACDDTVTARCEAIDACNAALYTHNATPAVRNATWRVPIATIRAHAVTVGERNEALDACDAPTRRPGVAPDGNNAHRAAVDKTLGTRYAIPGVLDKAEGASPPGADSSD